MGDTKKIRKPADLYELSFDDFNKRKFTAKEIEYYSRKLTPEEIRIIKAL